MKWLLDPLGLKLGQGVFPGWQYRLDRALLLHSGSLLDDMADTEVSLSMFIEWDDMAKMTSLANGYLGGLKRGTGVKTWLSFMKILAEFILILSGQDSNDFPEDVDKAKQVFQKPANSAFFTQNGSMTLITLLRGPEIII